MSVCEWSSTGSLQVGYGGQAAEGVAVEGVVGPGAALLTGQQPGLDELLEVVADRRLAEPRGSVNSHTQTGSGLVASWLTIFTRWESARALNSRAVASASASDSEAAPKGAQHAAAMSVAGPVVVARGPS